jgi:hypothetical protein
MLSLHQSDLSNDVKLSKTFAQNQDETTIQLHNASIYEPYIPKYVKSRLLQEM